MHNRPDPDGIDAPGGGAVGVVTRERDRSTSVVDLSTSAIVGAQRSVDTDSPPSLADRGVADARRFEVLRAMGPEAVRRRAIELVLANLLGSLRDPRIPMDSAVDEAARTLDTLSGQEKGRASWTGVHLIDRAHHLIEVALKGSRGLFTHRLRRDLLDSNIRAGLPETVGGLADAFVSTGHVESVCSQASELLLVAHRLDEIASTRALADAQLPTL